MRALRASSSAQEACRFAVGNRLASQLPNQVDSESCGNTGLLNLNGPRRKRVFLSILMMASGLFLIGFWLASG